MRIRAISHGTLALLLAGTLSSCGPQAPVDSLPVIDLGKEYPKKEILVQNLFDVEYVPLETTDEFVTQGSLLAVSEHYVVVKNLRNDGNIYLFSRQDEHAVRCINRLGQSGEEYTYVNGLVVDEAGGELFVLDSQASKILVYDLEGRFRRSIPFGENTSYYTMLNYDKDHLIVHDASDREEGQPPSKPYHHAIISKQDGSLVRVLPISIEKLVGTYVRTDGAAAVVFPPAGIVPNRGDWLLTDISADTVYSYIPSGDRMKPFLALIPSQDPVRLFAMGTVTDRYYFMEATRREFDFTTGQGFGKDYWAYDVLGKAVYTPVIQNADFKDGNQQYVSQLVLNGARLAVVHTLTADQLVSAYEEDNLNDGPLKDIASRLDMEDNPVLMLMKYKKP